MLSSFLLPCSVDVPTCPQRLQTGPKTLPRCPQAPHMVSRLSPISSPDVPRRPKSYPRYPQKLSQTSAGAPQELPEGYERFEICIITLDHHVLLFVMLACPDAPLRCPQVSRLPPTPPPDIPKRLPRAHQRLRTITKNIAYSFRLLPTPSADPLGHKASR